MTVTLKLRPDMEARLQAKAQVQGISTEDLLQSLLENALAPISVGEAIALYAAQTVTQGQAAALAGLSRTEFIDALGKAGVCVFQYSAEEILEEANRA